MGQSSSSEPPINIASPAAPAAAFIGTISPFVTLGAGCFWGTEKYIKKDFQKKFPGSIKSATVGFMSPDAKHPTNPSYEAVCSGSTGHVEVLEVELHDPNAHYEELVRFFYQFHDPTTNNRQGNDMGSQYGSWIFTYDEKQSEIANGVQRRVQEAISRGTLNCYTAKEVMTKIGPATKFYKAGKEHQEYLARNPGGYCNHRMRFTEFPEY